MKKIKIYKGIDLMYNLSNGKIHFKFEGRERVVNYVFEAEGIIDEPVWEDCDLIGYFVDSTFDNYIGKAKAKRKDRKSGRPDWQIKGRFDLEYKNPRFLGEKNLTVYPANEYNNRIYEKWSKQHSVVQEETRKMSSIIKELSYED